MNHNNGKYDENACYDTNRINLAINNQFKTNHVFSTNYNEMLDVESGDLIKVSII